MEKEEDKTRDLMQAELAEIEAEKALEKWHIQQSILLLGSSRGMRHAV